MKHANHISFRLHSNQNEHCWLFTYRLVEKKKTFAQPGLIQLLGSVEAAYSWTPNKENHKFQSFLLISFLGFLMNQTAQDHSPPLDQTTSFMSNYHN